MVIPNLCLVAILAQLAAAKLERTLTPPMGWNSYNTYNCAPTEEIIKENAQALVSTGLSKLGYTYVTTDCGWQETARDEQGRLHWHKSNFPSGGKKLGDFLHGLDLKFGLYSGAGYFQCGSTDGPASLGMQHVQHGGLVADENSRAGYEDIDAESFASWGGDALK